MSFAELPALLRCTIPGLVIVNIANAREHWAEKMRRARTQRGDTRLLVLHAHGRLDKFTRTELVECYRNPARGLLIRLGRVFDGGQKDFDQDDNLNISLKHVRDGVCDALGFDDGKKAIRWEYEQTLSNVRAATVAIFRREQCSRCGAYGPLRDDAPSRP